MMSPRLLGALKLWEVRELARGTLEPLFEWGASALGTAVPIPPSASDPKPPSVSSLLFLNSAPQPGYSSSSLAYPLPSKREKMERKWIFKDTCIHHYYLHSNVRLRLCSNGGNVNQMDTVPESPKELGSPKLE